jgi:hypothetical protein
MREAEPIGQPTRTALEAWSQDLTTIRSLHVRRDNGEPWAHFWEKDLKAGNTRGPGTRVARYLKTFDIVSKTIREEDGSTPKGYKLESFADTFSRYLPL